jgi:type II secretion system protein G
MLGILIFMNRSRGFTMIELLVVVAIIGVLASILMVGYETTRQNSRDTRRASDITQIQRALELYATDNGGLYPSNPTGTQVANMNTGTSNILPYINPIPLDPTNTGSNGYRYAASTDRKSYTIIVRLEKNSGWCSVNYEPGYTNWNNSNGTTYPPCDLK